MIFLDLQLFGGRGSSSGGGGKKGAGGGGSGSGGTYSAVNTNSLPEMTSGTEKQISWAEDIRAGYTREFNILSQAVKEVRDGNGDGKEFTRELGVQYGVSWRGVTNTLGPKLRKLINTKPSSPEEFLSEVRKVLKNQTNARWWIDHR